MPTIQPTYVVDPAVILERIRALTLRADAIKPSYLPIMLTTFGKNWAAVADALKLRVEHENPMRALDLLEAEIARRETSEESLAKTLGVEA